MRVVTVAVAIAGTTAAWAVPAHADEVRTLNGPATHDPDVHLTYVGCGSFFAPAVAPQSRLNLGPFTAPVGRRSLGLVPPGPGTATGPFSRFDSLTGLDATFSATGELRSVLRLDGDRRHAAGSGLDRPRRHRPGGRRRGGRSRSPPSPTTGPWST